LGVFLCLVLRVVCLRLAVSGGSSAVLVGCLAGRCPALPGLSGPLRRRRLLPVRRRLLPLPAVSGPLVRLSVGWRLFGANKKALTG